MKWRNGKYEKIVDSGIAHDATRFMVLIYQKIPRLDQLSLVESFYFPSRELALPCASKYRLARLYPGRLLNGGDFYE